MEDKRRSKRSKPTDEGVWDCSVCTYRNSPEAFKCEMCDVRKGTSTRKPKLNSPLVAQQVVPPQYHQAPPAKKEKTHHKEPHHKETHHKEKKEKAANTSTSSLSSPSSTTSSTSSVKEHKDNHKKPRPPRLKNIDRSSGQSMEVTVGNVTVIITDYKPKKEKAAPATSSATSPNTDTQNNNMANGLLNLSNGDSRDNSRDSSFSIKSEKTIDMDVEPESS